MTNKPTNEKIGEAKALLDLCNRLGEQTAILTKRVDTLESVLRKLNEAQQRHDQALTALSRSVEALAALLAGVDVLQPPNLH